MKIKSWVDLRDEDDHVYEKIKELPKEWELCYVVVNYNQWAYLEQDVLEKEKRSLVNNDFMHKPPNCLPIVMIGNKTIIRVRPDEK